MSRGIRPAPLNVQEYIEAWSLQGDSPEEIARELNSLNLRTPHGSPWRASTVRSQIIALDEAYSEAEFLLDQLEDKRLIRLGIDPDGDPSEIMLKVHRLCRELEAERQAKPEMKL